ncbi:MAG TPA: 50S ribosomal protein L10 [Anaerolineaceae bacterium]|nr:50S ribosomal protein L10 [Anaerolineaceae bacterium]
MAFSKKHKSEMLDQYGEWLNRSQAVFLLEYKKMTMKDIDALRAKARDLNAEMHVVKNTLFELALDKVGIDDPQKLADGSTIVGFAFSDPPALAKLISDATAKSEVFMVKGGFLGKETLSQSQVKALADLPPLPVLRAQLLGVLQAPASKLVRTINEPGRSVAAVIKAHAEQTEQAAQSAPVA